MALGKDVHSLPLYLLYLSNLLLQQSDKTIKGIITHNTHHKISLYADYVLLYLQDPANSLQETIKLIHFQKYLTPWIGKNL